MGHSAERSGILVWRAKQMLRDRSDGEATDVESGARRFERT